MGKIEVPLEKVEQEAVIKSAKEKIFGAIVDDPTIITRVFFDPEKLEELDTLEQMVKELFPAYYSSRIEPLIQAQKREKIIRDSLEYSRWSLVNVDSSAETIRNLIEQEESELESQISNKVLFKKADSLARVRFFKETLYQDLLQNNVPKEVPVMIDAFLKSKLACSESIEEYEIIEEFCDFLTGQVDIQVARKIEEFMAETPYWRESGRRQVITPDTYQITPEQLEEIREIDREYRGYMVALNEIYCFALENMGLPGSRNIIEKLEGGLPEELILLLRKISKTTRGRVTDSLRFDLIADSVSGKFFVGEVQVITGGTPPAILYRQAFEAAKKDGTQFVEQGILEPFIERLYSVAGKPVLAILYSERPYSSNISKSTSFAGNSAFEELLREKGIKVRTVFASDLERREDGRWYFRSGEDSDKPITTIYNRADTVSSKAVGSFKDPSFMNVINVMANGEVDAFPPPIPITLGKGMQAALFDADFQGPLERLIGRESLAFLRSVTPETIWISEGIESNIQVAEWIRKGAYQHATRGLIMGIDDPEAFREQVAQDMQVPFSAILQRLIESEQPAFRVLRKFSVPGSNRQVRLLVKRPFRLRVEPTSIDGRVVDVLVTGNEKRIVHGSENSIMAPANIKSRDDEAQ